MLHSIQNRSFWRRPSQPISWLSTEKKLNLILHSEPQKRGILCLTITLANLNRFLQDENIMVCPIPQDDHNYNKSQQHKKTMAYMKRHKSKPKQLIARTDKKCMYHSAQLHLHNSKEEFG